MEHNKCDKQNCNNEGERYEMFIDGLIDRQHKETYVFNLCHSCAKKILESILNNSKYNLEIFEEILGEHEVNAVNIDWI